MKMTELRSIWIAAEAGQALTSVAEAHALPGRGLEGDRYFFARGTFSNWPGEGRHVTLIDAETLEAVQREFGIDLSEGRHRRNLVTCGFDLTKLHQRTFRIGTALFRGIRPCPPCQYLADLLGSRVLEALKGRGGYRVNVVEEGILRVGDAIEFLDLS